MVVRIGVFGGTFDPPHIGHLITAVNVRHALALDTVLMVVANVPWQKVGTRAISPAAIRFDLVEAAVRGVDGVEASDIELRRGGESYTADTLEELADRYGDVELFVIVGSDAAAGLTSWRRSDEVRERASIIVVDRPGAPITAALPGWRWSHVEVPHVEVSSTDLRHRVVDGRPLDFLLTESTIEAIGRLGLYQDVA